MNQAFPLYRLQQLDTQIDQAEASLAQINRLLSGDEAVLQAGQAAESAAKRLRDTQTRLKQAEYAAKEVEIKLAQSESNLYAGRIKNPKELQDLQKEIASLKKHLGTLQDQQLEVMVDMEDAEGEEQSTAKGLVEAKARFAEQSSGWLGQRAQFAQTVERLKTERGTILPLVPAEHLRVYDQIRKRKSGVAVTTARDGACSGCGAEIRPSELQAARAAKDLVFCTSCGRILYAG